MKITGIHSLFRFPGWNLDEVRFDPDQTLVFLSRDQRHSFSCPYCGKKMTKNTSSRNRALDVPLGISQVVYVDYEAVQCRCRKCNSYHTFVPECIGNHGRATWRFKQLVSRMCRFLPALRVTDFLPLSTPAVIKYDKQVLLEEVPKPCLDGLKVLLIDEKSIGKGHAYVTCVMNGQNGELLYMEAGKKKTTLEGFFAQLSEEQKASIEAVGMDRAGSYSAVVKEQIPHADIVWDKFHLVANYNDVITGIRRDAYRQASAQDREIIKGQRYNLLRLWERNDDDQKKALKRLLNANEDLNITYILSEALRQVWTYTYRKSAEKYLDLWISWAVESGVKRPAEFAVKTDKARDGILNFCKHKITTGKLEGFNNLISRVIHRSCGIKDLKYLFMKMRQQSLLRGSV